MTFGMVVGVCGDDCLRHRLHCACAWTIHGSLLVCCWCVVPGLDLAVGQAYSYCDAVPL